MSETPAEIIAEHLSDTPGWIELGRAEKIIAALAAAGYKILPREPTEAMTEALFIDGYRAMWDAAP